DTNRIFAGVIINNSLLVTVYPLWTVNGIFFFFQAEDGIRDRNVTGVQTCALPIYTAAIMAKITDAFGSPFDCLSPLIKSANFRVRKIKETKSEIQKNKTINDRNVMTIAQSGK